jgi:hypothetical protein
MRRAVAIVSLITLAVLSGNNALLAVAISSSSQPESLVTGLVWISCLGIDVLFALPAGVLAIIDAFGAERWRWALALMCMIMAGVALTVAAVPAASVLEGALDPTIVNALPFLPPYLPSIAALIYLLATRHDAQQTAVASPNS